MKPIIKWSGGKSDEIKLFKEFFPQQFDTYYEPFVGGGSVFFHLNHPKNVINDVHKELIALYRAIKNGHSEYIVNQCKNHWSDNRIEAENLYYYVRDNIKPQSEQDVAFKFYYLMKTCFRGMLRYNKDGEFNIPWGRYKSVNFKTIVDDDYSSIFAKTEVLCQDFTEIYKTMTENDFVFLDPPYDTPFSDYGYCQFGREEHKKLAECFKNSKAKQLMVISETDFIADLYDGYIVGCYDKKYRFRIYDKRINSANIDKPHLIICNNIEQSVIDRYKDNRDRPKEYWDIPSKILLPDDVSVL